MANYFRCSDCGKFISYKDYEAMTYTPYGGVTDLEPPEPIHFCGSCYGKITPERLQRIQLISWIKPQKLFTQEQKI